MKILLLAGEESGLLYANRLKEMLAGHDVRGYSDYGFKTSDLAVMGFGAVLRKIGYFITVKKTMERAIDEWRPDVVCTIDYPGMNLKLAAYAKSRGIRAVHVVCPQVWAWKAGRIPKIQAALDRLCCFFPFEPALFAPGFAEFVGHPLAEGFARLKNGGATRDTPADARARTVAVLPGSRIGEIEHNLPTLIEVMETLAREFGGAVEFIVPAANERALQHIASIVDKAGPLASRPAIRLGGAREALLSAECAVVASGTATLEAALARCPTVLVYRVSPALAWFARRVIKGVRHIGLTNVVWEKEGARGAEPMPELLQENFTAPRVAAVLRQWLSNAAEREAARSALDAVMKTLESGESSFDRIKSAILEPAGREAHQAR